jgi:hypothetical protein
MNQFDSVEPPRAGAPWSAKRATDSRKPRPGDTSSRARGARGAAMSRAVTLPTVPETRVSRTLEPSLAVLIEVPAVRVQRTRHFRPTTTPGCVGRVQPIKRNRRRLRREVRLAGCVLLALTPLVSACTIGWSSRPARILACAISDSADSSTGRDNFANPHDPERERDLQETLTTGALDGVVLSIEPATAAPVTGREIPVIFPGYVLPADSLEDRAHEGN